MREQELSFTECGCVWVSLVLISPKMTRVMALCTLTFRVWAAGAAAARARVLTLTPSAFAVSNSILLNYYLFYLWCDLLDAGD